MNRTVLVIGIIFLLIGASVVSSTDNKIKDISVECPNLESEYNSEILSRSDIAYGYIADSGSSGLPEGPCYFYLDDPGNIYSLAPTESNYFLIGGTWTSEGIWYGCEYATGSLWTINPNNGDMTNIGGGGTSCNGLSWDPVYNRLYGVSDSGLYEYDPETGEQEFIGSISGPLGICGIAFDGNGTLYVWDILNLWIIETFEATLVGPLGIFAGDGHFDYDTDILYLSTYISTGQLYECDEDTGNCTLIGNFEGGAEITCLAIPYNCSNHPPYAPTIDGPISGNPNTEYDFSFNATDPEEDAVMYNIDWGDNNTEWTEYGDSGVEIILKHTWDASGKYTIKAQAIDINGAESNWSNFTITMPRDKSTNNMLLLRIFERFPLLQKLIQQLWIGL
jgi:hypothetical protein